MIKNKNNATKALALIAAHEEEKIRNNGKKNIKAMKKKLDN